MDGIGLTIGRRSRVYILAYVPICMSVMQSKKVVWIELELADALDAIGETEGLSQNKNRYADVARMILNRAVKQAEGAQ